MDNDQKFQINIESTIKRVICDYRTIPRKYLTENDIVTQAYKLLEDAVISNNPKLSIHSELRPYIFNEEKGIQDNNCASLNKLTTLLNVI